ARMMRTSEPPHSCVGSALAAPGSRTGVEHRDRAAVLRPAGYVIAHRDRTLLAVGDGPHARALDPARDQVVPHGLSAACAECDVVFARAPLVGVTLDREAIPVVELQPLRLLVERCA